MSLASAGGVPAPAMALCGGQMPWRIGCRAGGGEAYGLAADSVSLDTIKTFCEGDLCCVRATCARA